MTVRFTLALTVALLAAATTYAKPQNDETVLQLLNVPNYGVTSYRQLPPALSLWEGTVSTHSVSPTIAWEYGRLENIERLREDFERYAKLELTTIFADLPSYLIQVPRKPYPDVVFAPGITSDSERVFALYNPTDPTDHAALGGVLFHHQGYPWGKEPFVAVATYFPTGRPTHAEYYLVKATGEMECYRDLYNWAVQGSGGYEPLPAWEFAAVRRLAVAPPPSDPPQNVANLLLVTFASGDKRITRLYDKRNLPAAVKLLHKEPEH